ncbi:MAG: phage holin family protein [Pseudomonadota bacterium]
MENRNDLTDAPSQFVTAFRQFTQLMQNELQLAKAEASRKLSRAGTGLALLALSAILALAALNTLAGAAVGYLATNGFDVGMAALIVGGALLLLAACSGLLGKQRLSAKALTPRRTASNLRRDVKTIAEAGHGK